jgi:cytochrome c5
MRRSKSGFAAAVAIGIMALFVDCGGATLTDEQSKGKRIYESLCDKCHKLIPPKSLSDEQWDAAAEKFGGRLKLDTQEIAQLKAYLTRANDENI